MAKTGSIFLNLLNLTPNTLSALVSFLGNIDNILKIKGTDLEKIPGLKTTDRETILDLKNSSRLDKELELIKKNAITVIDIFDESYPALLKEISSPPLVLYVKGDPAILNKPLIAVVGTRRPTAYGISMAREFADKLTGAGLGIVSGLARGIDTAAHEQAIKKGVSVAVLGSGLFNIYPKENISLSQAISKKGAVVSEFALDQNPLKENFPRRNRIISGLCCGTLIVEAAVRSGALITARLACEQNREVFALPGETRSPLSAGTHRLIKEGAKLVDCVEDILEELNMN